ncbi:hypothetical protein ACFPZ0_06575 [Streptomonospora nanhaiensis]|uniref:Uncharacterized protein n=1 Tax=Streptomonospora nanhaiensis TaxID=1323731 RepID=A0A853BKH1_9ACTN|nr:hypothetical protein [Streptomonospora nanhaiensis]MBV2364110.1 hypothetical protein [Streptomonospora nanhaiensis]MBX9388492.1 hypothetical protein [Streptomonospora nanhaiensis]NYI95061.1 hypothetical protein [Streptomonospora nanhaiensis]
MTTEHTAPVPTLDRDDLLAQWARFTAGEAMRRLSAAAADDEGPLGGEDYRRRAERTIRQVLDEAAQRALNQGRPVLNASTERVVAQRALAQVCGLGPLQELLEDPDIENIIRRLPERPPRRHSHAGAARGVAPAPHLRPCRVRLGPHGRLHRCPLV